MTARCKASVRSRFYRMMPTVSSMRAHNCLAHAAAWSSKQQASTLTPRYFDMASFRFNAAVK
eukprot:4827774-Pleurochrysis_carterae.AAC.1